MSHRVLIPTPLRPYTGQQDAVEADGGTVGEVLSALTAKCCVTACTSRQRRCSGLLEYTEEPPPKV